MSQNDEFDISQEELQKTLIGFLGHTYKEVAQFDSRLVSANNTLAPKKQEFHNIANKVFQEALTPNSGQIPIGNVHHNNVHHQQIQPTNLVHQNVQPTLQFIQAPVVDPNQLEFSFDNSVTALSIDKRLTDIENRLKKLDITLSKVLVLLEQNDTTNLK
jgi:outer membrane protein OmpA-like peptidoglycan-associated protein